MAWSWAAWNGAVTGLHDLAPSPVPKASLYQRPDLQFPSFEISLYLVLAHFSKQHLCDAKRYVAESKGDE